MSEASQSKGSRMSLRKRDAESSERSKWIQAGMLDALNAALDARAKLNEQPYDGVLGQPPEWMPAPLVSEFFAARDIVLRNHSSKQVLGWMRACRALARYSFEHVREVEALVYIRQLATLGKRKGIDAYLGRGRYRVLRAYAEQSASHRDQIIAEFEQNSMSSRRSIGGRVTADKKRKSNEDRDNKIREEAKRLRGKGKKDSNIPGILAKQAKWLNSGGGPLGDKQIGRILKGK